MIRLLLVRHGESEWNVSGRVQGQAPGVPLTDRGHVQAAEAARVLTGCGASLLLASDLLRAQQTAAPIAAALGLPIESTPLLREQALGDLEGRLGHDLAAEPVPDGLDISEVRWGGGESVEDVYARLAGFVADLRRRAPGTTVVAVTHGGPIAVLDALLAGRGHREASWDVVANGAVVEHLID